MLTTTFANNRPANFNILAQSLVCEPVTTIEQRDYGNFCWCAVTCAPYLPVFSGDTFKENDRTDFIFYRYRPSDSVFMYLDKDGVQVDTLDDATLGEFKDFGSLFNPNLIGYIIDWKKVFDLHGTGLFKVRTVSILLGVEIIEESVNFKLMPYNELAADLTFRLETWREGYIENSLLDFSGMTWYGQIRLWGTMKNKQPEFTTTNYKDTLRIKKQIQDQVINSYELEFHQLTDNTKDTIVYQSILANRLRVTDYS